MKIGIAAPIQTVQLEEYIEGVNLDKAPEGIGGIPVTQLVKGLLKTGYEVSVYSLDQNIKKREILHSKKLTLYFGPYRSKHRIWDFFKLERENIRDFILADKPDIVHAHWTYEFALGALASEKPTLISVHDWAPTILRLKLDHYRFGRFLMACATFIKGSHFLANSPYIQKCIKRYLRKDVPMIPYALDESLFFVGEKHFNISRPTIVSINNGFDRRKNVKTLMWAYRIIKETVPNCRLILIGSGFERNGEAYKWAKKNYLSDGIDFVGLLSHTEVLKILESADLLIHSALEESFGMTLLEAMAKKTPVIGGKKSGAVPWVLNCGESGILTDVKSPKNIAKEVIKILGNEKKWKIYSINGYKHVRSNFSSNVVSTQYSKLYIDIIKNEKGCK